MIGNELFNDGGSNRETRYATVTDSDDSYNYGPEIDLQVTRKFMKKFAFGLKYAFYDADNNALNVAHNPVQSTDNTKFWAWINYTY
jgi:hypothetical protein